MKSELVNWFRVNGFSLLGFVISLDAAFLFGYLVLSDVPFLQFADFTLVSSISSQAVLFLMLAAPAFLFQVRMILIEGMIPPSALAKVGVHRLGWAVFPMFLMALIFFVRDLRPGLIGFLIAIGLVFSLYHPTKTSSVGATDFRKFGRLLRVSPKRVWRLAMKPYLALMLQNCAWLFAMILSVWIGFLRFDHVANDNIQLLEIDDRTVQAAVVGRNSIGLIGRNEQGDYFIYPLEAISSIALPKQ